MQVMVASLARVVDRPHAWRSVIFDFFITSSALPLDSSPPAFTRATLLRKFVSFATQVNASACDQTVSSHLMLYSSPPWLPSSNLRGSTGWLPTFKYDSC
jgi:hypothetical protein